MRIYGRLHLLNIGFWDSQKVQDYHGEVFVIIENSNLAGSEEVEYDGIDEDDVTEMIHNVCGYTNIKDTTNSQEGNECQMCMQ